MSGRAPVGSGSTRVEDATGSYDTFSTPEPIIPNTVRDRPADTAGTGSIPIETTAPEKLLRHNISDEQLEMFRLGNRDTMAEAYWAFIGGALGDLIPMAEAIYQAYFAPQTTPMNRLDLFKVVFFFCCVVIALTIRKLSSHKGTSTDALVETIRKQGKQ